jgi:hypothetical protein
LHFDSIYDVCVATSGVMSVTSGLGKQTSLRT